MRHRSESRYTIVSFSAGTCSPYSSSYICGSCSEYRSRRALRSSRTEFHYAAAVCGSYHTISLCRYKCLVVHSKQQERFHKLSLDKRSPYSYKRLIREYRRTLRNSPYIACKFKISEIFKEALTETALLTQIFYILICKLQILHIEDELLKTCHNSKTAFIRYLSEEHIEISDLVLLSQFVIAVCHSKFIKICEQSMIQYLSA